MAQSKERKKRASKARVKAAWSEAMCGYRPGKDGPWRCVVLLCSKSWTKPDVDMNFDVLGRMEQLVLGQIGRKDDIEVVRTIVADGEPEPFDIGFEEMAELVVTRQVDCVAVPDIRNFGSCSRIAHYWLTEVLVPGRIRFLDASHRFDSLTCDVDRYLKRVRDENKSFSNHAASAKARRFYVPFGYVYDESAWGDMAVDPVAASAVREIFNGVADGMTYAQLSESLQSAGVPTPTIRRAQLYGYKQTVKGSVWGEAAVHRIVTNLAYSGDMPPRRSKWNGFTSVELRGDDVELIRRHHAPLVDKETLAKVESILAYRSDLLCDKRYKKNG